MLSMHVRGRARDESKQQHVYSCMCTTKESFTNHSGMSIAGTSSRAGMRMCIYLQHMVSRPTPWLHTYAPGVCEVIGGVLHRL